MFTVVIQVFPSDISLTTFVGTLQGVVETTLIVTVMYLSLWPQYSNLHWRMCKASSNGVAYGSVQQPAHNPVAVFNNQLTTCHSQSHFLPYMMLSEWCLNSWHHNHTHWSKHLQLTLILRYLATCMTSDSHWINTQGGADCNNPCLHQLVSGMLNNEQYWCCLQSLDGS